MSNLRWKTAKRTARDWVRHADELYIPVRYLLWKGFAREFALFGAHVMELYLKAYLIYRTGKYPLSHELDRIYEICMEYDDFFKDETLVAHIVKPGTNIWDSYSHVLRYPESLVDDPKHTGTGWILGTGGTHQVLDRIAQYVGKTVLPPTGSRGVIREFIEDSESWLFLRTSNTRNDWLEIRKWFLYDNPYFS